jgi:mycothiol synthase
MAIEVRYVHEAPRPQPLEQLLAAAIPDEKITRADLVSRVLLDPNLDPEGSIAAYSGDRLVGYCLSLAPKEPTGTESKGFITLLAVHPEQRHLGIGGEILRSSEAFLRGEGCTSVWISPYGPGYFAPGVDQRYEDGMRFLTSRGYAVAYEPISMETSTDQEGLPEWLRPSDSHRIVHPVVEEAFTVLEFVRREFPHWAEVVAGSIRRRLRGDNGTGVLGLSEAEEVQGFAHYDGERFGPIGVATTARGKGYGQHLMFATLHAQRRAGFSRSYFVWSDDRTAERLYKNAGFRTVRRFSVLRKTL